MAGCARFLWVMVDVAVVVAAVAVVVVVDITGTIVLSLL